MRKAAPHLHFVRGNGRRNELLFLRRKAAPHLHFVRGNGGRNELLFLRRTPVDSDFLHFLLSCFPHSTNLPLACHRGEGDLSCQSS